MTAHDDAHHERPNRTQQQNPTEALSQIFYIETMEMSMMKCTRCGEVFDEPFIHQYSENLDGEHGWATFIEWLCPSCGSEDLEECDCDE